MKPYTALYQAGKGDIKIEQAAEYLNTTPRRVQQMIARWGDRLGAMNEALGSLDKAFPTRKDYSDALNKAAETLKVTRRDINQLLTHYEIARNVILSGDTRSDREEKSEKAQEKFEKSQRAALSFISGADDIESAAEFAEVSSRQMRRWVEKLLGSEQQEIKDLKHMTTLQRRRLADQIEGKTLEKA